MIMRSPRATKRKRKQRNNKHLTELEVDGKDLRERISRHIQAKDDATKQLDIL